MSKSNKRKRSAAIRARQKAAVANPDAGSADSGSPPLDPPFGYRLDEAGEREAAPEEVEVIERMRELSAKRIKPADLAARLNKEELMARGAAWDARAVVRVLRRGFPPEGGGAGGKTTSPRDGSNRGAIRKRSR